MIKTKNTAPTLPLELKQELDQAFRYNTIAKQYQDLADASRKNVQAYLETAEDLSIEAGKGFSHPHGTVIYSTRENYRVDPDQLIELVKNGTLSIESIVNLAFPEGKVARVEPLKIALGSKFDALATVTTTNYITLRPTGDFKSSIVTEFPELESAKAQLEAAYEAPAATKVEQIAESAVEKVEQILESMTEVKNDLQPMSIDDILGNPAEGTMKTPTVDEDAKNRRFEKAQERFGHLTNEELEAELEATTKALPSNMGTSDWAETLLLLDSEKQRRAEAQEGQ